MSHNKRNVIAIAMMTTLIGMSFLFSGVSYSAFLNKLVFKNDITNFVPSQTVGRFAGGDGSVGSPYVLNSSEHLRNLQRLNMLDIFNKDTYFILGGNIDFSGEALCPIGTEDHPFNSQFDGKGYTISNLVVNGNDTDDIGMFGYTGINSRVRNFFLIHPTINVGKNNVTTGVLPTTNVLASDANVALAKSTIAVSGTGNTLTLTGVSNNEIELEGSTAGKPKKARFYWKSSNTQIFNPKANNTINYPTGVEIYSGLYTFQVSANIQYIDDDSLKVYDYTLERWNVELKCDTTNSTVTINKRQDGTTSNIYRTKHREDENGALTDHGLNVGFFIGHCDGGASYLGLYGGSTTDSATNGIINLNGRKSSSTGSLIGRDRLDNPFDNTAKNQFNKYFDFSSIDPTIPSYPSVKEESLFDTKFSVKKGKNNSENYLASPNDNGKNKKNTQIINDQNTRAETMTDFLFNEAGVTNEIEKTSYFARYYPKALEGDTSGYKSIATVNSGVDDEGNQVIKPVLRIDSPLRVGSYITDSIKSTLASWISSSSDNGFYVENGLWFWATRELKSGFLQAIFSRPDNFKIKIKLKYIVVPADENNLVIPNAVFCALDNKLAKDRISYANVGSLSFNISNIEDLIWRPKNGITESDGGTINLIDSVDQYNNVIEKSIEFEVNQPSSSRQTLSPMIAFGIGSTEPLVSYTNNPAGDKSGKHDYEEGFPNSTYYNGYIPYGNDSANNEKEWDDTNKSYYCNNQRLYHQRTHVWDNNIKYVDFLDFDLQFTTKDGNTSSLTNNVDFLYTDPGADARTTFGYIENPTVDQKQFSNWDKASNTKVGFVLDADNQKAVNNYYRTKGFLGTTTVYLYYNSPYGTYQPKNTPRFTAATIRNDTSLPLPN